MSVATFPLGISARGNGALWYLPTVANPDTGVTVAEFTAGLNLSCAIAGFAPSSEQSTVTRTRYCSRAGYEIPGTVTTSIPAIEYVYDPQEPDSDEYEWYSVLAQGVTGYFANRLGMAFEDAVTAGQYVDLYQIQAGVQNRVAIDPTAEGDELRISQRFFNTGPVRFDTIVIA